MYKSKEFDYDLWTTDENGVKRYWAKVRSTGEVSEISSDVIKYLRSEEKRLYREYEISKEFGSILSLDVPVNDDKESWFEDHGAGMSEMETSIMEEEFRKTLTPLQLEVYEICILGDCEINEYSKRKNMDRKKIESTVKSIRRKFKKCL